MSRMIHNGDISYSSINAPNYSNANRGESCFRSCFLSFPYATITSTFLVISGLIISFISILHLAGVFDRLSQDLFYKRYLWLNELRVFLWFVGGFIAIIILTNLIIGFATSSSNLSSKGGCSCTRHSTTNCLVRLVFLLNQLIFFVILLLLLLFCIVSFVLYLLTTLCNDDARSGSESLLSHDRSFEAGHQLANSINLQPFAPMLFFSGNETQLLLFRDNRLKTLCRDYVATLMLYNLIALLGIALLFIGFHCYLINLTVNRIRLAAYKKYTEVLFLNSGMEMNTFNDTSYDNGERF